MMSTSKKAAQLPIGTLAWQKARLREAESYCPVTHSDVLDAELPQAPDLEGCTRNHRTCRRREAGLSPRCTKCIKI